MENMETPEGKLIGQATRRMRKSVRSVAEEAGISEGRWRQIVKGYQSVSAGNVVPVRAPAGTLAKMAQAVGVSPQQLVDAGRPDAAEALTGELEINDLPDDYWGPKEGAEGYQWGAQAVRARIGALAKQRREELGLSRDAFAERAGLKSKQTVQNFEFARSMPRGQTLRQIERVLEWKNNSIDDALVPGPRAGSLTMEDFDLYDRTPQERPLESFSTEEILYEAIRRLEIVKGALGPTVPMSTQFMFGLAANTDPSHLERMAEESKDKD